MTVLLLSQIVGCVKHITTVREMFEAYSYDRRSSLQHAPGEAAPLLPHQIDCSLSLLSQNHKTFRHSRVAKLYSFI
jgi:hypothetical protein